MTWIFKEHMPTHLYYFSCFTVSWSSQTTERNLDTRRTGVWLNFDLFWFRFNDQSTKLRHEGVSWQDQAWVKQCFKIEHSTKLIETSAYNWCTKTSIQLQWITLVLKCFVFTHHWRAVTLNQKMNIFISFILSVLAFYCFLFSISFCFTLLSTSSFECFVFFLAQG